MTNIFDELKEKARGKRTRSEFYNWTKEHKFDDCE